LKTGRAFSTGFGTRGLAARPSPGPRHAREGNLGVDPGYMPCRRAAYSEARIAFGSYWARSPRWRIKVRLSSSVRAQRLHGRHRGHDDGQFRERKPQPRRARESGRHRGRADPGAETHHRQVQLARTSSLQRVKILACTALEAASTGAGAEVGSRTPSARVRDLVYAAGGFTATSREWVGLRPTA